MYFTVIVYITLAGTGQNICLGICAACPTVYLKWKGPHGLQVVMLYGVAKKFYVVQAFCWCMKRGGFRFTGCLPFEGTWGISSQYCRYSTRLIPFFWEHPISLYYRISETPCTNIECKLNITVGRQGRLVVVRYESLICLWYGEMRSERGAFRNSKIALPWSDVLDAYLNEESGPQLLKVVACMHECMQACLHILW